MKKFLNIFLALLFVSFGIGFFIFWEFYVSEKVDTVEVIVAAETIDFKSVITKDNIEVINVRRGNELENAIPITAYDSLIGKHASISIEKGTQLYLDLIDTYNLVPDSTKGEFVAPIPKEWLFAVPGSLRRTYVADIYAISDEDQQMKKALIKSAEEQGVAEEDQSKTVQQIGPGAEPILSAIRVASVKDSGNKEVTESEETNEATGQVAALEIIATDEMLDTITDAMNDGYKLYVVYKFERSNETAASENEEEEEGDELVESAAE